MHITVYDHNGRCESKLCTHKLHSWVEIRQGEDSINLMIDRESLADLYAVIGQCLQEMDAVADVEASAAAQRQRSDAETVAKIDAHITSGPPCDENGTLIIE